MTLDEGQVFLQLDSPLLGSLWHAAGVMGPATAAQVVAVRVYEAPAGAMAHLVDARRLGLPEPAEAALRGWPLGDDSVFGAIRARPMPAGISRLWEPLDEMGPSFSVQFKPLEAATRVVDCLALAFPVVAPAWCLMLFLRCGTQPAFGDQEFACLRRLRLPLVRLVKEGYRHELHLHAPRAPGIVVNPPRRSAAEVYSRLSKTERRVFSLLCVDATEREIGTTMSRSPHTIHVHVKNIYRKLGISSRRQLAAIFADTQGDTPVPEVKVKPDVEVPGAQAPGPGAPAPADEDAGRQD